MRCYRYQVHRPIDRPSSNPAATQLRLSSLSLQQRLLSLCLILETSSVRLLFFDLSLGRFPAMASRKKVLLKVQLPQLPHVPDFKFYEMSYVTDWVLSCYRLSSSETAVSERQA
jgi:hypothetical protein